MTQDEVAALFLMHSMKVLGRYVNSQSPLKSKCLVCGNIITPRLDKVKLRGHQCGYCTGRKDPSKKAEHVVRKLGHVPLEPYKNALTPWRMKCGGCGKTIAPKYNSIQQGRWGCRFCGHQRGGAKKRELGAKEAIRSMRAAGCEPLEPYPGSSSPWKSRCLRCDSIIRPRLTGIKTGQGGCTKCGRKSSAESRMLSEKEAIARLKKLKLRPIDPYPGTAKPWKCECLRCGSIVKPRLNYLSRSVFGCAVCAGNAVDEKVAIASMKKSKLIPQVGFPGADVPWPCICKKCNRDVSPRYSSIKQGQGGCIWCARKRVDPVVAIQAMKAKGLQPLEPFVSASKAWRCKCHRCSRTLTVTYKKVSTSAGGCKFCAPNYVNLEVILRTVEKAGYSPLVKYKNASTQWRMVHRKCGKTISISYDSIRAGHNCKYCAGTFIDAKEAVEIMEMSGFKPLTKYPGARKPWPSKCVTCNRKVFPQLSSVKNRGSGCLYCSGGKVDVSDALRLMKENDLLPIEPYKTSTTPWRCICQKCKRQVTPMYSSVREGQGGCKFCADWGIDYGAPGYIYLITHQDLSAHKLGIGNSIRSRGRSRIEQHEKYGWKLYKRMDFEITDDAFQLEQKVLTWIREVRGLSSYLSEYEMPQGGFSETVDANEIDLPTIWAKVREWSKVKG